MEIVKFYEIGNETVRNAHFLITGLEDKSGKTKYVAATLFDGETLNKVNIFNPNRYTPEGLTVSMLETMGITNGSILETDISVSKEGYFNINNWKLNTDETVTKANFAHTAPVDVDIAFDFIVEQVKSVDSDPDCTGSYKSLSYLTRQLLEKNKESFKTSSAAVMMHHNFIGGLVYHTYRMIKQAIIMCDVYGGVDKELLICGTALHDIGKIKCMDTSDVGEATVTVTGRLLDHAIVGVSMIQEEAQKDTYDPNKITMLQHMIASHHGTLEWGAITTPAFPEAEMLHLIDMIDSRMNMFEEAYKGQEPGTISKNKVYGLEQSYIYKPL